MAIALVNAHAMTFRQAMGDSNGSQYWDHNFKPDICIEYRGICSFTGSCRVSANGRCIKEKSIGMWGMLFSALV